MKFGLCNLSIVPIRAEAADTSEMVTQLLYGESFKVIEERKKWSRIRFAFDGYEGWVDNKQFSFIEEDVFKLLSSENPILSEDLVDMVSLENNQMLSICMGSSLNGLDYLKHLFDGRKISLKKDKSNFIETALLYLNTPYLWGGRTPFGIDCSGFTQMIYKLNGHKLLRDASQQSSQGEPLSFIEESEPGDLAFFDNNEGSIIHVGIIMEDNHIIHAHGKVRIDRLDHTGIFNYEKNAHTHKLRVIKRIV
ncbi:NlpC/P60 family protein [Patiriisocius sp. Uisw_017]|jgi:hypothetical protein|uniref:C40 family peptidase n=1 Tax=Patiriisocius sp. Uisw_017 TaxID=3230968 RepID=UPI0039ED4C17